MARLSSLAVFSQFAYSAMTELQAQKIDLFNAATRGGLVLRTGENQGDYANEVLFAKIAGLVRRRNAYGTGAVTAKDLAHLTNVGVKVAAGIAPVIIDPSMFHWINQKPEEAGVVIGKQLAEDALADMLNTAILSLVSALSGQASNVYDYSGTGVLSLGALNSGAAKLGDRSSSLACWVIHSKSAHDVFGAALTNANNLFSFGSVNVISDGFGRPLVITDAPALLNASPNPDVYHALGLMPAAAIVDRNNDFQDNIETTNGDENIQRTYQAEWSYNLRLKGFAWDIANGGASPVDAALATATNWDKVATSAKDLAGVLVKSQ